MTFWIRFRCVALAKIIRFAALRASGAGTLFWPARRWFCLRFDFVGRRVHRSRSERFEVLILLRAAATVASLELGSRKVFSRMAKARTIRAARKVGALQK